MRQTEKLRMEAEAVPSGTASLVMVKMGMKATEGTILPPILRGHGRQSNRVPPDPEGSPLFETRAVESAPIHAGFPGGSP